MISAIEKLLILKFIKILHPRLDPPF